MLCAAAIDSALEELLEAHFLDESKATEDECGALLRQQPMPPLGSTPVKARLAFLLDLIPREQWKAIAKLSELRNRFAHWVIAPEVTLRDVRAVIDLSPKKAQQLIHTFPEPVLTGLPKEADARRLLVAFTITVCEVFGRMIKGFRGQLPNEDGSERQRR
jgi:DNA-binding MltR family transcriptional regulator